jgi:hypothetical protein
MDQLRVGNHIQIHVARAMGFGNVAQMLLEHFDTPEHADTTFILGDNIFHPVDHFRALYPGHKLVIYQLEQMVGSVTWHPVQGIIEHLRGADEIWDYDPLNVKYLSWYGVTVDRVVPMRYTNALRRITLNPDPAVDVLFYGYLNERRFRIVRQLQQALYNRVTLMWLTGFPEPELDRYIADARIVLNLHAFEPWHRQEQTRIFYPLINGRLVVSETSEYNAFGNCIVEADEANLAETLLHWLADNRWRDEGLAASERYRLGTCGGVTPFPDP